VTLQRAIHRNHGARRAFGSFSECYATVLRDVHDVPEFSNAPRGRPSREVIGASFTIEAPRDRLLISATRRANPVFNFAELLWYLAARSDVDSIAYYAPSIRRYSRDGAVLEGTAYGPRIFRFGPDRIDQWSSVVDTLRCDRDSKRAVMQIFSASELCDGHNPDVACTLALQFMIRGNSLEAVGYMRANDAYRGMVSDVFSFTFIQELIARELGVEVGRYHHNVGSLHIYEADIAAVERVLAHVDDFRSASELGGLPPVAAGRDAWADIRRVLAIEEALRLDRLRLRRDDIEALSLPDLWRQVVAMFELHRAIRHGGAPALEVLDVLCPALAASMQYRWPEHLGSDRVHGRRAELVHG
jgi:thymidylate synthase